MNSFIYLSNGLSIRSGPNNQIELGVYDKRKDFPFKVVRYPNLASEIPTNIPYGVFIGQLYRFYRICSAIIGAVVEAVSLALTLFKQGAKILRLLQCFYCFVRKRGKRKHWSEALLESTLRTGSVGPF